MNLMRRAALVLALAGAVELAGGCAASNFDFSTLERPQRAAEMDAYQAFVGKWTWEAKMVYPESAQNDWTGTAEWDWTLDKRCLTGRMSAKSPHAEFETQGVWSRHPKSGKYIWWMFNNWGYPQQGTAKYDEEENDWSMKYKSVGLDGSTSYGEYELDMIDGDTIAWTMIEWADGLHLFKKIELDGTYKRVK